MLSRFKTHNNSITSLDLIYKFNFINCHQLPNLKNIHINISDPVLINNKPKLYDYLYLLEQLTNKKSYINISKKNKIHLKIKKNNIIGCSVHLTKQQGFIFLEYLILFILPFQKNFIGIHLPKKCGHQLTFLLKNWFHFLPKQNNYKLDFYQQKLAPLNIVIKFNKKNILLSEIACFLSSFNVPVKI